MNKMCLAHLGVFLLALHLLSSQVVQAQAGKNMTSMSNSTSYNMTTMGPVNVTSADKNGSGSIDAFTMLLPLAVIASLLYGWSQ
ncbi:hypothetical protein E3U43_014968 [Larimichthys crocea]|uniref:Uncharacterized protein n=1 Tax=Larimichthys crocea TaxID=215358 RepID=A0ACD3RNT8_LARCR|nr:hypothetical protein E3U43_014968 [Larimichthys crocea]